MTSDSSTLTTRASILDAGVVRSHGAMGAMQYRVDRAPRVVEILR